VKATKVSSSMRITSEEVALWMKEAHVFPVNFRRTVSQKDLVIWAGFQVLKVQEDYNSKNEIVSNLLF
jgi:hypothetical protein